MSKKANQEKEELLDLDTLHENLYQIVDEVVDEHTHKVITRNNKPAAVLLNISDFEVLQELLLAIELKKAVHEMKEEDERGELLDFDDLVAEFGVKLTVHEKPEGYDQMIPERYRDAS